MKPASVERTTDKDDEVKNDDTLEHHEEKPTSIVEEEDTVARRTSAQLSVASDASDVDGYGRYRRDERVDTSTVDEESMYDEEYEDEDEEGGDHGDGDSVGTSDEYVNISGGGERHSPIDEEESYTPENTPPPSPPRMMLPPPPLASDWAKYMAESGHEYYYNTKTHVSQWTRPASYTLVHPIATSAVADAVAIEEENQQHVEDATYVNNLVHEEASEYYASPDQSSFISRLFQAVTRSDETAQLQEILQYDIDGNALNAAGLTPLHVAVQHGNARGAAMLLDYGVLVDGPTTGMFSSGRAVDTPLVMACRTNHPSLVRLLIRYGASIYTHDGDSNSVLHIAIRCWSDEVLHCLLSMDSVAAILNLRNADDETPLHLAARHGNANAVRAVLASGASLDAEDAQGRTPLVVSIMENRVECAQILQDAGYPTEDEGGTYHEDPGKDEGPVMYDHPTTRQPNESERPSDSTLLHGLQLYLAQLLEHTTTDPVLVSTVRQYVDLVQKEMAAKVDAIDEARRREETLLYQIDQLTNTQSSASEDLAREREENEQLRQQLESREAEFNSLQAAYDSLSSRASMLESIARSAQDKLKRERAEHARQEEYWNQTIDNSLRENAALLQSVQSMQEGWAQHQYYQDTTAATTYHDNYVGQPDPYTDAVEQHAYPSAGYEGGMAASSGEDAYYASTEYDTSFADAESTQYYASDTTSTTVAPLVDSSTENEQVSSASSIPPSRVDAVWNRFFENMSRAAEANDKLSQTHPAATQASIRQAVTTSQPALPPASAVFDSIRQDNKPRLRQLLLSGISPNIRDLGEKGTPLHLATELGDLDAIMLLCEYGANVEGRDENGNTPLLVGCAQGHYDCTKFLLQSAANQSTINSNRDSALHLAAWDGSVECVEILLEYDVDVLAHNAMGLTALANLKTRSPLRHRFDDLAKDHPMARTLRILEATEAAHQDEVVEPAQESQQPVPATVSAPKPAASTATTSWGRWIIGSVFGTNKQEPSAEQVTDENDDDEEDVQSEFEEAESSPSKFSHAYTDDLRPPPEIEAVLRRTPLSPPSAKLPPPPPEVLAALEKQKLTPVLLSPSHSVTRFASPPPPVAGPSKKTLSTTPTGVRSRYVDTFNSP